MPIDVDNPITLDEFLNWMEAQLKTYRADCTKRIADNPGMFRGKSHEEWRMDVSLWWDDFLEAAELES